MKASTLVPQPAKGKGKTGSGGDTLQAVARYIILCFLTEGSADDME